MEGPSWKHTFYLFDVTLYIYTANCLFITTSLLCIWLFMWWMMMNAICLLDVPWFFTIFSIWYNIVLVCFPFSRGSSKVGHALKCNRNRKSTELWWQVLSKIEQGLFHDLPSGNLTQLWKITIFYGKIHYKWPFSIAMLNYRRVIATILCNCM